MGSFCESEPARTETAQTQTYTANPLIRQAGKQAIGMAQDAASQPFQMPAAPVAGFNPFQQQSFNQILGMQGGTQPYFDQASGQMTTAQTPVSQEDISSYMNPYADQAMANMKKYVFDPQRRDTMGSAVRTAGGVGAERLALTSQNLDKTQADAIGGAQAGFYGQAMSQAQRAKEMALQSASGWANLGTNWQNTNLQATGALAGAGTQQQTQTQREQMSPYQQRLAELAYPFQTAQFMAGITGGLAPAFGGTTTGSGTTTQYAAQPSLMNQLLGFGVAGAGAYGSAGGFGSSPYSGVYGSGAASGGNNGGPVFGYAEGGEVESEDQPYDPLQGIVPKINLPMGGGQNTGAHLNLAAPIAPPAKEGGGNGDAMKAAAKMAMMFINRGGVPHRADGGFVYPDDEGQGFDDGGTPQDAIDERFSNPFMGSDQYKDPEGTADLYKQYGLSRLPPQNPFANIQDGSGFARPGVMPPQATSFDALDDPGVAGSPLNPKPVPTQTFQRPQITVNPMSRPQQQPVQPPPPPPVARGPQMAPRPQQDPSINTEMTQDGLMMPRSALPYPDATDRDWGQKATRSPWMSLVEAGAKMMQSTKGGLGGLGEGLEAGAKSLDHQRRELRSEQAINQRAEALYRQSKQELDKYTKMTPYQQAIVDQGKYMNTGMTTKDGHPVLFNQKDGTSINGATGEPISPDDQLIPRTGGAGSTAMIKNIEYLAANLGMSKDEAFKQLRQSVKDRDSYVRLVQTQEKILQGDMQWMNRKPEDRQAEAQRIVRSMQEHVTQQTGP